MPDQTTPPTFDPLVPIGRFSEMTRLSITTLRHYGEIGLLPPAFIDPVTGYRSYAQDQANRAEAIRRLRSVDMPLDEIRAVLDEEEPDSRLARLEAFREQLAERLVEQQRQLAFVGRLIDRGDVVPYGVERVELEEQPVLSISETTSMATVAQTIGAAFGALGAHVGASGIVPAGPPFIVFHDIIDHDQPGTIEVCFPVAGSAPTTDRIVHRTLAGGSAVSTVHRGAYDEIQPAYHTLVGWMHEHRHEPSGPPREVYLDDPTITAADDLRTSVVWPTAPAGAAVPQPDAKMSS